MKCPAVWGDALLLSPATTKETPPTVAVIVTVAFVPAFVATFTTIGFPVVL
jgi:hypothetical protein